MSTRELARAIRSLLRLPFRLANTLIQKVMATLLRGLLALGRRPRLSQAGFVLPTVTLLLLVLVLTVGSIAYRTYTRTIQTIGERQQRVIYNAATPAVDRARAKLEYMFDARRDTRFPSGVPRENLLLGMMLNKTPSTQLPGLTVGTNRINLGGGGGGAGGTYDPYTFPDERRINIGDSGEATQTAPDNAWRYRADTDGDGTPDATIVYSINFRTPDGSERLDTLNTEQRASLLQVRQGPLSNASEANPNCPTGSASTFEGGWTADSNNSSILRKNFQIDAYALPDNRNGTVATLEVQQDRELNRGNKWGAWFRYDLEIFPGARFNMNGAMHTQGSLFTSTNDFTSYMISSQASCLYTLEASEITGIQVDPDPSATPPYPGYQSQFVAGILRENNFRDNAGRFDIFNGPGTAPTRQNIGSGTDSIVNGNVPGNAPIPLALDPVLLQTQDRYQMRGVTDNPVTAVRDPNWNSSAFARDPNRRMVNMRTSVPPYVDDTYRADNRQGPKPNYGRPGGGSANLVVQRIGRPTSALDGGGPNAQLSKLNPPSADDRANVGLDGYWERRARREGMRIIVGQRLELGDPAGWGGPLMREGPTSNTNLAIESEPLRPYPGCASLDNQAQGTLFPQGRCSEARQRRSLWDNLAAVQAAAIYHADYDVINNQPSSFDLDTPRACLALTVHPGTAGTLERSSTFEDLAWGFRPNSIAPYTAASGNRPIISDFFRGRGTNGWEYETPFGSGNSFATQVGNANSAWGKALRNLAYLAGDPRGGAPSFEPPDPTTERDVHPYPSLAMWGDFSVLRRILDEELPRVGSYANLSPADKSTLHTAACALGMLAYNLDYLSNFNPTQPNAHDRLGSAADTLPPVGSTTPISSLQQAILALRADRSPLGDIPDLDFMTIVGTGARAAGTQYSDEPEVYVRLLERWRNAIQASNNETAGVTDAAVVRVGSNVTESVERLNQMIYLAQMLITKYQVERDREFGFQGSGDRSNEFRLGSSCNALATNDPLRFLCSARPHYPVLYNLFPLTTHNDVSDATQVGLSRDGIDSTGTRRSYLTLVNSSIQFQQITAQEIGNIALQPRRNAASWELPVVTGVTPITPNVSQNIRTPNSNRDNLIKVCFSNSGAANNGPCLPNSLGRVLTSTDDVGTYWRVPFKDAGIYNGRENLAVRVLNVHLNLLRQSTDNLSNDTWLPRTGVIYAFREDAVSEANIVRPARTQWSNCNTESTIQGTTACVMRTSVDAYASTDPPLYDVNYITPKPVDYYADPDRRPHGFRLTNGAILKRDDDRGVGLSFISDNVVYIQGNFNLHKAPSATVESSVVTGLEEFTETLTPGSDWDSNSPPTRFYGRRTPNTTTFARADTDDWRPAEVLADGVTIISENFCDGSIADFFLTAGNANADTSLNTGQAATLLAMPGLPHTSLDRYGCQTTTLTGATTTSNNRTSYLNSNRPSLNNGTNNATTSFTANTYGRRWLRTNIADTLAGSVRLTGTACTSAVVCSPYGTSATVANYIEEGESPIMISPAGNPYLARNRDTTLTQRYGEYNTPTPAGSGTISPANAARGYSGGPDKAKNHPTTTRVNAIIISGIVPSRANQSYGGLHNFPRLLEDWRVTYNSGNNRIPLYISGSLLQLNFSNQATAPFDQRTIEVGVLPSAVGVGETLGYYDPPERRWGYDVGLQLSTAGPVSARFVTLRTVRSEFYSEPPADDPYIRRLANCATSNIDDTANNCSPATQTQ